MQSWLIASSVFFVGFIHSLGPAHWLPILLLGKSKRWSWARVQIGSVVTGGAHIVATLLLAFAIVSLELKFLEGHEEDFEKFSGVLLMLYGIVYGVWGYFSHRQCHGHEHHGPDPKSREARPIAFLFLIGFTPCFAVVPSFMAVAHLGWPVLVGIGLAFAFGVWASLILSTSLVRFGIMKLDHPILEHYGDLIAGLGIFIVGLLIVFLGHGHVHEHVH